MKINKLNRKHTASLFSLSVTAVILCTGCMDDGPVSPNDEVSTGTVLLEIELGKVGSLAKRKKIELDMLIITITGKNGDSIFFTDTSELSESGEVLFEKNIPALPAPEDYTLTAKSLDKNDEVIHSGEKEFTTVPADTVDVELDLDAKYSMLNVGFAGLPDSVTSVQLIIEDVDTLDSTFEAGSIENVILSYDYLEATEDGIEYRLSLKAGGSFFGFDSVLFAADTTVLARSGVDSNYTIALEWLGPVKIEGLVAYYPFNGNANDESGNGHNGTVYGAQMTEDRFGISNSAYHFDGSDDVIEVPFSDDFDFSPDGTFSFAVWVNPTIEETYHAVMVKAPPAPDVWDWGLFIASGFYISGSHLNHSVSSGASAEENVWTHVAVIYNDSSWAMYINGNLEDSAEGHRITQSSGGIAFGRKGEGVRDFFSGAIDDIRIYDRPLTEDEIDALYHENGWTGTE